jgi:deoxyribonuclease V
VTTTAPVWPRTEERLHEAQRALAAAAPPAWSPLDRPLAIGGVWFTAPTRSPGEVAGEPAWAAAVAGSDEAVVRGETGAAYVAGALALREGPLLEAAVRALPRPPDVLLVNASGRDHPRGAGLALHVGAVLGLPTVGVTDRPLLASGPEPGRERWSTSPLVLDGRIVAAWLRTRSGIRPLSVHPGWRTDLDTAIAIVRANVVRARTPEPLRLARRAARLARARDEGRLVA